MIETKIYFSYENNDQLLEIIEFTKVGIKAFTYQNVGGCFENKLENSCIIEIIHDYTKSGINLLDAKIKHLIGFIKLVAKQKCVLITKKKLFYSELL